MFNSLKCIFVFKSQTEYFNLLDCCDSGVGVRRHRRTSISVKGEIYFICERPMFHGRWRSRSVRSVKTSKYIGRTGVFLKLNSWHRITNFKIFRNLNLFGPLIRSVTVTDYTLVFVHYFDRVHTKKETLYLYLYFESIIPILFLVCTVVCICGSGGGQCLILEVLAGEGRRGCDLSLT